MNLNRQIELRWPNLEGQLKHAILAVAMLECFFLGVWAALAYYY